MESKHNRKIVFSGIDCVGAKMENSLFLYDEIRNDLQPLMISSGYLDNAPFLWIGMVFRYGLKNEVAPHYRRIDKKDGELELAKELDMRILLLADQHDPHLLKEFFEIATLDCLIHAGKKYKRPIEVFEERRSKLGDIPDWDPEMDENPQLMFERYEESRPLQERGKLPKFDINNVTPSKKPPEQVVEKIFSDECTVYQIVKNKT